MAIVEAPIAHDETTTGFAVPSNHLLPPQEQELAAELSQGKPASFFWTFIDQQGLSWDARGIACAEFKIFFQEKAQERGYDPDSWGSDIKTPLHVLSAVEGLPLRQAWEFAKELREGFNMRAGRQSNSLRYAKQLVSVSTAIWTPNLQQLDEMGFQRKTEYERYKSGTISVFLFHNLYGAFTGRREMVRKVLHHPNPSVGEILWVDQTSHEMRFDTPPQTPL